jgi:hypothetical protein
MANPRKTVDFTGIQYHADTYIGDGSTILYDPLQPFGSAQAGKWVSLSADMTVQLANDADDLVGRVELVEPDGMVVVQTGGYALAPAGASAAVTRGKKICGALGAASARGYVRAIPVPGASYVQAEAVAGAAGRHAIIANGTTTALLIKLDGPSGAS